MPWWKVYDGNLMSSEEVLAFEGLKVIQLPEEEIGALEVIE